MSRIIGIIGLLAILLTASIWVCWEGILAIVIFIMVIGAIAGADEMP